MRLQKSKYKFKRGFKKWSDDKSIELRTQLGLKEIDPLCAFDLSEHLGIPIFTPNQINGLENDEVEHLLKEGSQHWSAATVPLPNDEHLVLHNPSHSKTRQQSNIMHEIAHILCGHEVDTNSIVSSLSGFLRNHDAEQEQEAEWLGACLQLPKPALLWALKEGMAIPDMSEYFTASTHMVTYRLNVSGAKIQYQRQR